jgi:hypothetical protein
MAKKTVKTVSTTANVAEVIGVVTDQPANVIEEAVVEAVEEAGEEAVEEVVAQVPTPKRYFIATRVRLYHPFQEKYIEHLPVELAFDSWTECQYQAGLLREVF